ncbi:P-loop containing nucleoside triphosphate hydrolase protein [Myriangium duriaei CBS 260.36]|uniref:RNA helicase n=1 Tax=Myriangium duriaei CBS 260.36 TaxID=1168546 RepID=A0A9P4IU95_9PEZI|nr:P-loop containing nucleoside triphosphate hydrolase protein [Myriangium duriaei CBS 260.36]
MPNKPHPPRNKPSKAGVSNAAGLNGEDTSFIVFGDGKSKKKGGNKQTATPPPGPAADASKTSKGKKGGPATTNSVDKPADEAKKPDTRTLVSGSSSWTGKLPLNLLSEHCQRAKWEKPEYTMHRVPGGFVAGVILRAKNTRTGEVVTLPAMQVPRRRPGGNNSAEEDTAGRDHWAARETAVEARHVAAAWGLFRVASAKNLAMALPPGFRDLWRGEFAVAKKEDTETGKGWWYESDPFAAKVRVEEEGRKREKERAEREERREKERKEREEGRGLGGGKEWGRAPKVDMGRRMRRDVEGLVRRGTVWNLHGVVLSEKEKKEVVSEVEGLGFKKAHVQEAVEECKDKEETLEWLLIHVPEDDLPKWCLPEGYTAGVSLASGDVQRENKVKRLAAAGYAAELCNEVLIASGEDEGLAAERLQAQLLDVDEGTNNIIANATDDSADFWNEEQAVLESIFGERYQKQPATSSCRISLEISNYKGPPVSLLVRRPQTGYPNRWPVVAVEATLPAYIRLSIIKRALQEGLADQIGEQMVFHLIDWLEQNVPSVIESPGPLKSISRAVGAGADETSNSTKRRKLVRQHHIPIRPSPNLGAKLLAEWQTRQQTAQQQKMIAVRQRLPAWQLCEQIVDAANSSQVTIISGETGSGKSTQSVQFILDDMIQRQLGATANIICTQPRRISALGLADRVAEERCSAVGTEVGYSIRGESRQKQGTTRITFVTTGVLLRRLQSSGGDAAGVAAALEDVSHVVIDEVHERSLDTDFLMTLLRDVLKQKKELKLILMSATLDAELFEKYFAAETSVAKIQIAGRTHPVTDIYLEDILRITQFASKIGGGEDDDDENTAESGLGAAIRSVGARINYDLIATTVDFIDQALSQKGDSDSGAILIFLPGTAEIDRTLTAVRRLSSKFHALPLHASLQPAEQRRVFPRAPTGKRKIIAATNVAETSITIEDVVAVIDTGRVKETSFDPLASMVRLAEVWASQAACKQRRGRAGRVTAGTCYKLYTRNLETTKMPARPAPEIQRVPLEQLCLSVKAMGVADVPSFLRKAITPPANVAIDSALTLLHRMGALDAGALTALGRHLSLIPADLRCAKFLVLGAVFGVLEASLIIASVLSVRSPFVSPQDKREEANRARDTFHDGSGDLICALHAFSTWADMRASGTPTSVLRSWCTQNFLSHQTLIDIASTRAQYLSTLIDIRFVPPSYTPKEGEGLNAHAASPALLRGMIAAAFAPQIARVAFPDAKYAASVSGAVALDPESRAIKFYTSASAVPVAGSAGGAPPPNERVFLHPSSALFSAQSYPANTAFVSYFTKMATSKTFVRDVTPCNAFALLLFGGEVRLAASEGGAGGLLVDGWIRIRGWARIGVLVARLRAMLDSLLEKKLEDPGMELGGQEVLGVVRRLVELDGLDN